MNNKIFKNIIDQIPFNQNTKFKNIEISNKLLNTDKIESNELKLSIDMDVIFLKSINKQFWL